MKNKHRKYIYGMIVPHGCSLDVLLENSPFDNNTIEQCLASMLKNKKIYIYDGMVYKTKIQFEDCFNIDPETYKFWKTTIEPAAGKLTIEIIEDTAKRLWKKGD